MPEASPLKIYLDLVDSGFFGEPPTRRRFIEEVIDDAHRYVSRGQGCIVIAPPGIGKTAISITYVIASLLGYKDILRVIHVLPLRSLANDIKRRFEDGLRRLSVKDASLAAIQYGLRHESPYYTAPYILSTIDMYVVNLLKIPTEEVTRIKLIEDIDHFNFFGHYEVVRASILSALNIFDEVHLIIEGERSWYTLISILKYFTEVKTPFILMSATLPDIMVNHLKRHLGEEVKIKEYIPSKNDGFYEHEITKKFIPIDDGVKKIKDNSELIELFDNYVRCGKVAFIVNTVKRATEIYKRIRRSINALLLHSRHTLYDRERKINELSKRDLVISTQVIEVGIDASFELMITELAPISSLIQRFGRLARHDDVGYWLVFYDENTIRDSVYRLELLEATKKVLESSMDKTRINWHLPVTLSDVKGFKEILNSIWQLSGIKLPTGFDTSCLQILRDPFITSKDVLKYLRDLGGSLIRDGNYLPLYVGDPPSDINEFLRSVETHLIPSGMNFTIKYMMKMLSEGYDVSIAKLVRGRIEIEDIKDKSGIKKLFDRVFTEYILAVIIPQELYDGGIDGEGLRIL